MNGTPIFGRPGWMTSQWKEFKSARGYRPLHLDPTTYAAVIIDAEHHEVHEGHMWHLTLFDNDVDSGAAGSGVDKILQVTTPAQSESSYPFIHLGINVEADNDALFYIYEGGTASTAEGAALVPLNRNRNVVTSSLCTWQVYQTFNPAGGTILETFGLSSGKNLSDDQARSNMEWILKPNQNYVFWADVSQNDTGVIMQFDYYEHKHKDAWNEKTDLSLGDTNDGIPGGAY